MTGRRIRQATRERIAARYAQGVRDVFEVAEEFWVSFRSVQRILAEHGIKVRRRSNDETKELVAKLYAKGMSLNQVSAVAGCSIATAWRYVNERGTVRNRVKDIVDDCRKRAMTAWRKCGSIKEAARMSGLGRQTVTKYVKESGVELKIGRPKAAAKWGGEPKRTERQPRPHCPPKETRVQRQAKAREAMRSQLVEANRLPEEAKRRALERIAMQMNCSPATVANRASRVRRETESPVEEKPRRRTTWLFCPILGGDCPNASNCTDKDKPPAKSCLNAICSGFDHFGRCGQHEKCGPERSLWKCWKAGKAAIPLPSATKAEMLP